MTDEVYGEDDDDLLLILDRLDARQASREPVDLERPRWRPGLQVHPSFCRWCGFALWVHEDGRECEGLPT